MTTTEIEKMSLTAIDSKIGFCKWLLARCRSARYSLTLAEDLRKLVKRYNEINAVITLTKTLY